MEELLLYGKGLLGTKTDNHLCWFVCCRYIFLFIWEVELHTLHLMSRDQSPIFKTFFMHQTRATRKQGWYSVLKRYWHWLKQSEKREDAPNIIVCQAIFVNTDKSGWENNKLYYVDWQLMLLSHDIVDEDVNNIDLYHLSTHFIFLVISDPTN